MASVFVRETAATGDMFARDLLGARAVVTGARAASAPRSRARWPGAATAEGAGRLAAEAREALGEVDVPLQQRRRRHAGPAGSARSPTRSGRR